MAVENTSHSSFSPRGEAVRRLLRLAAMGLFALLALQALYYLLFMGARFIEQKDSSFAEGYFVDRALNVARGEPLYVDPAPWPHRYSAGYGVLTYLLPGLSIKAIGLAESRPDGARQAFLAGRTQSMLAFAALLAWLWFMGQWMGMEKKWCFLAILLFFSARIIYKFAYSYRADLPMNACVLWAWYAALKDKGLRSALIAAALASVAVYFKPTAVLSGFALGVFLLGRREWRKALIYSGGCIGFCLLAALILYLATDGMWFTNKFSVFGQRFATKNWPAVWSVLASLVEWEYPPSWLKALPLLGAIPALIPACTGKLKAGHARWAFLWSFFWAERLVLYSGSNAYYFLEAYAWATLLTVAVARQFYEKLGRRSWKGWPHPVYGLALFFFLAAYALWIRNFWADRDRLEVQRPWPERNAELVEILERTEGELFLGDGYPYWFSHSPPTNLTPLGYATAVERLGLSPEPLLEKIRRQDFEWVILLSSLEEPLTYQGIETPPRVIREALKERYEFRQYLQPYYLYGPRAGKGPQP